MSIRASFALLRVLLFFVSTHMGRIIAGSILLITGGYSLFTYGVTSHQVSYEQRERLHGDHLYLVTDGNYYLNTPGSQNYYIITMVNFTPWPDPDITFKAEPIKMTFIYRTDGAHLNLSQEQVPIVRTGYQVVEFAVTDASGTHEYTTPEYRDHPHGYYENRWLVGSALAGGGLIFFALTLLVYWLDKRVMGCQGEKKIKYLYRFNTWGRSRGPIDPRNLAP